jgi:hypothetical protein
MWRWTPFSVWAWPIIQGWNARNLVQRFGDRLCFLPQVNRWGYVTVCRNYRWNDPSCLNVENSFMYRSVLATDWTIWFSIPGRGKKWFCFLKTFGPVWGPSIINLFGTSLRLSGSGHRPKQGTLYCARPGSILHIQTNVRQNFSGPIPVAVRSEAWVCRRLLAGIAGSKPARSMDVCLVWVFMLSGREIFVTGRSLLQRSPAEFGVCHCD